MQFRLLLRIKKTASLWQKWHSTAGDDRPLDYARALAKRIVMWHCLRLSLLNLVVEVGNEDLGTTLFARVSLGRDVTVG